MKTLHIDCENSSRNNVFPGQSSRLIDAQVDVNFDEITRTFFATIQERWSGQDPVTVDLYVRSGNTDLYYVVRGYGNWLPVDAPQRFTHGVPVTSELHMRLVAERWLGVAK